MAKKITYENLNKSRQNEVDLIEAETKQAEVKEEIRINKWLMG